jgi:hypothetical protein
MAAAVVALPLGRGGSSHWISVPSSEAVTSSLLELSDSSRAQRFLGLTNSGGGRVEPERERRREVPAVQGAVAVADARGATVTAQAAAEQSGRDRCVRSLEHLVLNRARD